jgi:UDP-N-acetylglucosamine 4-epimerase
MSHYEQTLAALRAAPETWLVTGVAGFIGSNLAEILLRNGQRVTGLDNFFTGSRRNMELLRQESGEEAWNNFRFIEGDIRDLETCRMACAGNTYVLHQAALGSVPRSLEDPVLTHQCNVDGFLNMLVAAREARVRGFVYASSSSVYGDAPELPKREDVLGKPLSPYALTKRIDELYADVFCTAYGLRSTGLRYFNIFGPRQDPAGDYAAVIPGWFAAFLKNEPVYINGDGETSRDFCFIANCVQANILAATARDPGAWNQVYNIAANARTSLNELFELIRAEASAFNPKAAEVRAVYREFRAGDIKHSLADISKAARLLGYKPQYSVRAGLKLSAQWYAGKLSPAPSA